MVKKRDSRRKHSSDSGTVYKDRLFSLAEFEFLRAIETFRRKHGRVPTLVEGMRIAVSLGYRKQDHGGNVLEVLLLAALTDKQKLKIIDRINSTDPARQMPPPKSELTLEGAEFDVLVAYCTQ